MYPVGCFSHEHVGVMIGQGPSHMYKLNPKKFYKIFFVTIEPACTIKNVMMNTVKGQTSKLIEIYPSSGLTQKPMTFTVIIKSINQTFCECECI